MSGWAALAAIVAMTWTTSAADLRTTPPGAVTVLDARSRAEYRRGHVPGAVHVDWKDYRDGWLRTGRLPRDLDELAARLARLGVDGLRPVVVYGSARRGWGEEGRIVWMLHYLGHPRVTLLDGGWQAWLAAGGASSRSAARALPGTFTARPRPDVRATIADVAAARERGVRLLDVRSADEWNGATPYFEKRGGHIPGAVHLEWTRLLDSAGRIDRSGAALHQLRAAGLEPAQPVIVYCTGGVRSAEAFVALKALGFADVRNYDGSWYEWSADRSRAVVAPR